MVTYHSKAKAPLETIVHFKACRVGLIPRVQS